MVDNVSVVLAVVTPATAIGAALVGVILGAIFLPVFGTAIGMAQERRVWGTFVGVEVIGLVFLVGVMVARFYDGSPLWAAWVGTILLWSVMAAAAAITTRAVGPK